MLLLTIPHINNQSPPTLKQNRTQTEWYSNMGEIIKLIRAKRISLKDFHHLPHNCTFTYTNRRQMSPKNTANGLFIKLKTTPTGPICSMQISHTHKKIAYIIRDCVCLVLLPCRSLPASKCAFDTWLLLGGCRHRAINVGDVYLCSIVAFQDSSFIWAPGGRVEWTRNVSAH